MSSLKLTSFTPLNSDTKKKVITIWKTINDSNDSLEFRNPVDWKAMGLLDYLKYVQKPMDLNTINRKLRQEKYRTVENVLDDIQLIFDNCKVYNAPGSWIYNLADKLEKSFIKMICNFIPKIVDANLKSKIHPNFSKIKEPEIVEEPMEEEPAFFIEEVCYNDKIKFTDKLAHINSQNLEAIVNKIFQKNPGCIKVLHTEEQPKSQIPLSNVEVSEKPQQNRCCSPQNLQKPDESGVLMNSPENNQNPEIMQEIKQAEPVNSELVQPFSENNMQIEENPQGRTRRARSSRNIKVQKKQTTKKADQKVTVQKWQVGTKAQIFIDDLNYESFEELMKYFYFKQRMLQGMVEEKDKVMKKIKLD